MPLQIWCLHGNLQTPRVWDPLTLYLQQHLPSVQVQTENLWDTLAQDCGQWAAQFCQRVSQRPRARRILLGYSLGGRLALHAVLQEPQLWCGAIIVAADPGLPIDPVQARAAQLKRDRSWARRFLREPLRDVLNDWNRLPLFKGKPGPACEIAPYRNAIATAFINYSKGRQADLRPALQTLKRPPLLYTTGSEDAKYTAISQSLVQDCPAISACTIPKAGHRVPWDQPEAFNFIIFTFLNKTRE